MDPGGAQAAPAALVLHGGRAIGEAALVDDRDLGLVTLRRKVAVEVEHVARIRRVRGPGAPGNPDPHLAAHRRLPQEEVAPRDIGAPPAVALAEVRQTERIPRVLGESLRHALVVDDRVAVVRQLDLLREADVGVVGEADGPEVGLRPEAAQPALERGQLYAQLGQTLLGGPVRGPQLALAVSHALQQGHEAVVVGGRDRIELVVVAAGARERRAEEGGGRSPDHIVELVGPLVGRQHRVGRFHAIPRAADEEAGRGVRAELVTSELFTDETVVGQVGVESLDDVVAVRPGVGAGEVGLETVGLGEARHVQPMARPFLAEPGRGEQPVDHRRIGLVRRVGDERRDFRRRGR